MSRSCIDLNCKHLKMDRVPGRGYPRNIWSCPVRTVRVGYTVELMPQKDCPGLREIAESAE